VIKRIRLDLDDVLNTLMHDIIAWDGVELGPYEDWTPWEFGYDIIGATAGLKGEERMGVPEYWSRLPRELWANCSPSKEFDDIIDFCVSQVGMENVLPKELQRQYSITPRKWEYGYDTESVLIDDLPENCHQYEERGGQAIIVPRPWNGYAGMSVMKALHLQWGLIEASLGEIV
jgi:hypothetical protein